MRMNCRCDLLGNRDVIKDLIGTIIYYVECSERNFFAFREIFDKSNQEFISFFMLLNALCFPPALFSLEQGTANAETINQLP